MNKLTREQTISELREALVAWQDDEHALCQVAAERGLFCHGFAQWTFGELKKRHPQIMRSRPAITRAELEELANRWELARVLVTGERLPCDVQSKGERFPLCKGWDEFDDEQLAGFYEDLFGQSVEVVQEALESA
jgi:hypothetical protein